MDDRPLSILQLHNEHSTEGGATDVLEHERSLLVQAGHRVEQLLLPPADTLGLSAVRAGAKAVWNRDAAAETTRLIRELRPDVVHVHTPFPLMSPIVFRAAKRAGVPTVATLHSFRYACVEATCYRDGQICEDCVGRRVKWPAVRHRCYHGSVAGSGALALSLLVHRTVGTFDDCVDRYLALTSFARDLMVRDGFPADKIGVKPNSVPEPALMGETDGSAPYFFFAARLVAVKGVATLLEAWRQVADPDLRLMVAGDGEMAEQVRAAAAADPRIEWRGWLGQAEVTRLMAGAVATVVPSEWYEAGAPLTLIRSLSVGTTVVASDLANISAELVEDGAGTTFRVGEPASLAQALVSVWRDRDGAEEASRRGRASFEARYSPEVGLQRLVAEYHRVIDPASNAAG